MGQPGNVSRYQEQISQSPDTGSMEAEGGDLYYRLNLSGPIVGMINA